MKDKIINNIIADLLTVCIFVVIAIFSVPFRESLLRNWPFVIFMFVVLPPLMSLVDHFGSKIKQNK